MIDNAWQAKDEAKCSFDAAALTSTLSPIQEMMNVYDSFLKFNSLSFALHHYRPVYTCVRMLQRALRRMLLQR